MISPDASSPYSVRLVVHPDGDAWAARWIDPDGQESESFALSLPLTGGDHEDLRWYLETYLQFPGAGDRVRAGDIERRIEQWGRALFDAVFGGTEGTHVYRNLIAAAGHGRPAMLTLEADDPALLLQPWEMMRDRGGPLVFQGVTIRRQLREARQPRRLRLELPLQVLMIISRPRDAGFIDPRTSIAPMLDALDTLAGQVTVELCEPPTLPRLEEMIAAHKARAPFHIVHFDGHGTYRTDTGIGYLAFESSDDEDRPELVEGRKLGDLLARLGVPLVLLEACRSSALSDRPVFGSVAPALLESGVGSVIAFSHMVHLKTTRLLVERFYKELSAGLTVGQALAEARAQLRDDPYRWLREGPDADSVRLEDWFIPQLYQVGPDPALVVPGRGASASEVLPAVRTGKLHGFPSPPMYCFHGRSVELLKLERALQRYPAVVLSGMGGMGKTALAREAAAWWLRTGRFDDAVFHSFEQKAGADRVVQVLGQALEGEDFSARPADEQWGAAVELFRRRRMLLVWDNFESTLPAFQEGEDGDSPVTFGSEERWRLVTLFRELTEEDPLGRLLVTCRPEETGLPGVKEITLHGLARPDSLHLLAAVLDQKSISTDRKGYERRAIDALLQALDDHPLSIALVAPQLKELTPNEIREELREHLERFADAEAEEARNRSLRASLEFSKKRLSEAAQRVLPYLAWFEGGVFERWFVDFAELDAEVWEGIRGELVATALIRVEEPEAFNTPFLRFHPTLPFAARAAGVEDADAAEERFIGVYFAVALMVHQTLHGARPAVGMVLLEREEANIRSALRRAFRHSRPQEWAQMAATLREYLERSGRLHERDALVAWVRSQMPEDAGLDEATCAALLDHAWIRFSQGDTQEAVKTVHRLIARLENEGLAGGEDPTLQIALSYYQLGRIYVNARRPDLAIEPLQRAFAHFEELSGEAPGGYLSAALGELANTHLLLGQFDEALAVAVRGLEINRALGSNREITAALGRIGSILKEQGRYGEARTCYTEALKAAQAAGDLELQGTALQHQAILEHETGYFAVAIELGKKALALFQEAGDSGSEMRTCNLLGNAEEDLGHLDAAAGWYARGRELAEKQNDRAALAAIAQNVGVLHQSRAEEADDPDLRAGHLRRAVAAIEESLAINLERADQVGAASSYFQLGVLQRMLGELDRAEENLRQGLAISESLNLPEVYKDYEELAQLARDRGDAEAAAGWQAKHDAKIAELERLRGG